MADLDNTLDRPYGQQPEIRAAAVRVLERLAAVDLIEMLGLGTAPAQCSSCGRTVRDGRTVCRARQCGKGGVR